MKNKNSLQLSEKSEIILYQSPDGEAKIEVKLQDETVWLSQAQMEQLFQTDRTSITKHINNIFNTNELDKNITCAKFARYPINNSKICLFS